MPEPNTSLFNLFRRRRQNPPPPKPLPVSVDFFPPGWTVVLRGEWHIVVSEGIRAVQVAEAGELELRRDESGPMVDNHGSLNIWGIGAEYHVGEGRNVWLPWYFMAILAGALAPHVLDALPPEAQEEDSHAGG